MLEAIKYIDEVKIWEGWESIEELVRQLKPDFIAVSGQEYKTKSLVNLSEELQIEIVELPFIDSLSTSAILTKLTS